MRTNQEIQDANFWYHVAAANYEVPKIPIATPHCNGVVMVAGKLTDFRSA